jgi:hypothetical protein
MSPLSENRSPTDVIQGFLPLILAAGVSITGYLAAFAYEAGLTGTLDLPISLVAPQLPATVLAAASLLITASLVIIGAEVVAAVIRRITDLSVGQAVRELLPLGLFGLANAAFYQELWREWIWTFAPLLVFVLVDYLILPHALHRGVRGYRAKVLASQQNPWTSSLAFTGAAMRIGRAPFALVLFVALFIYFAYVVGRSAGLSETTYLITNDSRPTVVVRIYGNSVVTETYDPSTLRPHLDFAVRPVQSTGLVLRTKYVGHLATNCNVAIGCHTSNGGQIGLP